MSNFNLIIVPDKIFEELRAEANRLGVTINTLLSNIIADWIASKHNICENGFRIQDKINNKQNEKLKIRVKQ